MDLAQKYEKLCQQRREASSRYYHKNRETVLAKLNAKPEDQKEKMKLKQKEKYEQLKDTDEFKAKNRENAKRYRQKLKALKQNAQPQPIALTPQEENIFNHVENALIAEI